MAKRTIYIKGKRYFYYDTYPTYKRALAVAKKARMLFNTRYFILPVDSYLMVQKRYCLYFDKVH